MVKKLTLAVFILLLSVCFGYSQSSPCWVWNSTTNSWVYNPSCSSPTPPTGVITVANGKTVAFNNSVAFSGPPHSMSGVPQKTREKGYTKIKEKLQNTGQRQTPPTVRGLVLWISGHIVFFFFVRLGIWFDDRGRTDIWWRLFVFGTIQLVSCYVLFVMTCFSFT